MTRHHTTPYLYIHLSCMTQHNATQPLTFTSDQTQHHTTSPQPRLYQGLGQGWDAYAKTDVGTAMADLGVCLFTGRKIDPIKYPIAPVRPSVRACVRACVRA